MELQISKPVKATKPLEVHIGVSIARVTLVAIIEPSAAASRPPLRKVSKPGDHVRIFPGFRVRAGSLRSSARANDLAGLALAQPRSLQGLHRFLPL
jgi:hypothetical protein